MFNFDTEPDPFADTVEATPADFELRHGKKWVDEKPCDTFGQPKARVKRADLNPVQRRWFEANGWTYARVEHANAFGSVNVDLWGFGDYLACKPGYGPFDPGRGIIIVQTTTLANTAARIKKALKAPELAAWLASGGRFQVHGWEQPGGPGSRWSVVIREVTDASAPPERLKRGKR